MIHNPLFAVRTVPLTMEVDMPADRQSHLHMAHEDDLCYAIDCDMVSN